MHTHNDDTRASLGTKEELCGYFFFDSQHADRMLGLRKNQYHETVVTKNSILTAETREKKRNPFIS